MKKCSIVILAFFIFILTSILPAGAQTLKEIGSYQTPLYDRSSGRITNITLAMHKISGYILEPQEVFSFNQVVGPRTKATGFKIAKIFENRQVVSGYGGGICQLSSTLYQAALKANLVITERHSHSLSVKYIPRGKDATVAWGSKDLKFVNATKDRVMIKSFFANNYVVVKIFKIAAEKPVTVLLNDEKVSFPVPPYFEEGTVFVPLRGISEKLGFYVNWHQDDQEVNIYNSNAEVKLNIGSETALLNGQEISLSRPPFLKGNYVYVPLRFVAKAFGKKVQWQENEQTVLISDW
ncbi:VanW family protein [Bacillota bacterium LX-D]|nr:VanW family protein [Bacillota bacterium LX-D]